MSLNWKEIDLALSELDLVGAQLQRVVQPTWDTLALSFYKPPASVELLVCVSHGACRIHATTRPVPKPEKPQRFQELLRSRVRNGRLLSISQLGTDRVVRLELVLGGDLFRLYARLWSGAGNVILCDSKGTVIDALARKPGKGETAGGIYAPEEALGSGKGPPREFSVRELPGEGSFNERVDAWYSDRAGAHSRDALAERIADWYASRRAAIEGRLADLAKRAEAYANPERYRELGDLLMAALETDTSSGFVDTEDFSIGGPVSIAVDPGKSALENARAYYERYRKAASGAGEVAAEIEAAKRSLEELDASRTRLEAEENPFKVRAELERRRVASSEKPRATPGLSLVRNGWTLLVGRSAKENDELLRRHVRGNDAWLHARDWSGAYVFIKAKPGKSFPLELLLDAAALALYYSKGRNAGLGDVYWTFVKYLRRAKDGPKGLVIPMQEKNLRAALDESRLRELRTLIGRDDA
ncbi:MAG: DUF814 domain-containing protein [Spirochaetales bacterium]|nr:DUF814 domain-containing protein [Spirochaetales bacterium]